jgi:hypothetical protein
LSLNPSVTNKKNSTSIFFDCFKIELFSIFLEVIARAIRQEKEVKSIKVGKEAKLSLFVDDSILYVKSPQNSTKKPLELINEFSKVAGYKVNIQNSVVVLCTSSKSTETEIKKALYLQQLQKITGNKFKMR